MSLQAVEPPLLPIDPWLPKILLAVQKSALTLLRADPGSGKTTKVPRLLLDAGFSVLVVEPRRIAARLSASWIARSLGEGVGQRVGYHMRHEQKQTAQTKLLFLTEGMLTRYWVQDPSLSRWNVVVLDEFHERHFHSDLALAYLRELQNRRPDLRLIVMSATLESRALARWAGDCESFDIAGSVHPVALQYRPFPARTELSEQVKAAMLETGNTAGHAPGNTLVFLPGQAEIRKAQRALSACLDAERWDVIPFSSEWIDNYALIEKENGKSKVILSTNVAETSVTLPNITAVIDSGVAKVLDHDPGSGLPSLDVKRIAQACLIQRAGRAGRTAPGRCIRLFSEADFNRRPTHDTPEIQRMDLSQALLELLLAFRNEAAPWVKLRWLDPPPPVKLSAAIELLQKLGALNSELRLTPFGQELAAINLHPRLSAMVVHALAAQASPEPIVLAAVIIHEWNGRAMPQADQVRGRCDVAHLCGLMLESRLQRDSQQLRRAYEDVARPLRLKEFARIGELDETGLRKAIFAAFADRVGRRRELDQERSAQGQSYLFASGKTALLGSESVLKDEEWLVAIDARLAQANDPSSAGRIHLATAVEPAWILEDPFGLLRDEVIFGRAQQPLAERRMYGAIAVKETPLNHKRADAGNAEFWRTNWQSAVLEDPGFSLFRNRVRLLDRCGIAHSIPDFNGEFSEFLLHELASAGQMKDGQVMRVVEGLVEEADRQVLARNCPTEIMLASKKRIPVHYEDEEPWVSSRIQDFFGQRETPTICSGRHALLCKLLAPNYRPAQLTRDLKGFWQGSYIEIRKELRRRYPKHAWPENP